MWLQGDLFHSDALALTVGLCIVFFAVLTLLYSVAYMATAKGRVRYNVYILLTLIAALCAVFANNLVLLLVGWGLTGILLYLLIGYGDKESTPATARKTFIFIGLGDAFMMLGIALIVSLSDSLDIQMIKLSFDDPLAITAFLCLLVGVLAKAGAVPLQSWLVDTAEDAPTPVTAFLPAAVDKLLAIYLLARMSLNLFIMTPALNTVLLVLGAITIIGAGFAMLMQGDLKRLLGYCAVSQVGYILLGIGSGHPLGIAGALFHMVNHAIYKSGLFFAAGAVEQKAGTTDLERLGGLAKRMPLIFAGFLIAALAVAGIPPLNGFASKWMVYQGIIESGSAGRSDWMVWLVVAMFGSALTLAGMMKLIHAIFLGQSASDQAIAVEQEKPTPLLMLIPVVVLALLCILFGIGAYSLPLKYLILPILDQELAFAGTWYPTLATIMILLSLGFGSILYLSAYRLKTLRQTEVFIGGETLDAVPGLRVSGVAFYNTIQELPVIRSVYPLARRGNLDVYQVGGRITAATHRLLAYLHNGILTTYLSWCLIGMALLFVVVVQE